MAYAWSQLRLALKAITGAGDKRAGLIRALSKLSNLRMKDLPVEARNEFADLTERMRIYQWNRIDSEEVKKYVASLADAEVAAAISKIVAMRDALACYQPSPQRSAATKTLRVFGEHSSCY